MNQEKVGKFIAQLRKQKKITQEQLAEKLGVNSRSISRWENGNCMPDLSLLTPLSQELGVSVNDLISGELVDKEKYQEKFEENVLSVMSTIEKKNSVFNIIVTCLLSLIGLFVIWFCGYAFYANYAFIQDYDVENMQVIQAENNGIVTEKDLLFETSFYGNTHYLITTYEEDGKELGLIFVNFTRTLQNIYEQKKGLNATNDLTTTSTRRTGILLHSSNIPEHYKVYYTKTKFSKIARASNSEMKKIIKKSHFMFEK